MIYDISLRVAPQIAADEKQLRLWIAREKGLDARTIRSIRIRRRSIDARQHQVMMSLGVDVYVNEDAPQQSFERVDYADVSSSKAVAIVVGAGPGGLFAALRLIELGVRPIVLERGKDVHSRRLDIAAISRNHKVNPESNYSFGEGGAGAYSDGKLYTRSKKRGNSEKILRVFCQHGADTRILCDAHPYIGTDRLPGVIEAMRSTIEEHGGEVYFETRVDGLLLHGNCVQGVRTADGKEWNGPVILATGHSARDVYRWLHADGVLLEPKGLAVGARLEHPAELIDRIQYHSLKGRGRYLPAAEYSVVTQQEGRGVYSFCMCPGGFVVPAASGSEQVVVNGMSPSNRGGRWSNSGMVVEMHPEDLLEESLSSFMREAMGDDSFAERHADYLDENNPLRLMYFQEALERLCWIQGGRRQTAPAQRMNDFVLGRLSYDLPETSYSPGLISSPLHFWMPSFIGHRMQQAFVRFGRQMPGFLTNDATVIAAETRTSSPVRIVRDREMLHHVDLQGLYPCGEGAGYAGGIVSAGVDGERCAEALATWMGVANV